MMNEIREFEASLNGGRSEGKFYFDMMICKPSLLKEWMKDKVKYQEALKEYDLVLCITKQATIRLALMYHDNLSPSQRVKFRSLCEGYFGRRFV